MHLELVTTKEQKQTVKHIIENYHSYVPSASSVGRRIDWLVYEDDGFGAQPVGMIGIGSSVYPCPKDIMTKLNTNIHEYRSVLFNSIANNWRFCMIKQIPNGGTRILKMLREQAPIEWKRKYGDDLKAIITFVAGGNNGAVYLADNWEQIGMSSGIKMDHAYSTKWQTAEEKRHHKVVEGGVERKIILFKDIRSRRERRQPIGQNIVPNT